MPLASNEKPKYIITTKTFVGDLNAAAAGALGADTNGVVCYTAPPTGGRISVLLANTDDTAAVNVRVYIKKSGGSIVPLGIVNVPLRSGDLASTLAVDMLDSAVLKGTLIDNNGKRYIELENGDELKVSVLANMTALKHCYVAGIAGEYA